MPIEWAHKSVISYPKDMISFIVDTRLEMAIFIYNTLLLFDSHSSILVLYIADTLILVT